MAVTITGNTRVIGQTTVGVVNPPLLDVYPNALLAYSFRKLRSNYTGGSFNCRRSSDNATTTIGFNSNGDLDIASLLSFVGSGDGFVSTWLDQCQVLTNRGAYSLANGNQPKIVSAGSLITINGKPAALYSSASSQSQQIDSVTSSQTNFSIFCVISYITGTGLTVFSKWATNRNFLIRLENTTRAVDVQVFSSQTNFNAITTPTNTISQNNTYLIDAGYDGSQAFANQTQLYINGSLQSVTRTGVSVPSMQAATSGMAIGDIKPNGQFYNGYISEIVYYDNSTVSASGVRSNINNYYNIY